MPLSTIQFKIFFFIPRSSAATLKVEFASPTSYGFGVNPEAIKQSNNIEVTHINLNDKSVEGLRLKDKRAFSVQYHPESAPGPHDSRYLFDEFLCMMKDNK